MSNYLILPPVLRLMAQANGIPIRPERWLEDRGWTQMGRTWRGLQLVLENEAIVKAMGFK